MNFFIGLLLKIHKPIFQLFYPTKGRGILTPPTRNPKPEGRSVPYMSLSENLTQYQAGLREGQRLAALDPSVSPEGMTADDAVKMVRALLPEAIKSLAVLLVNPETDSVRMQAIKTVFEYSLGKPSNTVSAGNELDTLIRQLQANDSKS
jgi:hypothetical protein